MVDLGYWVRAMRSRLRPLGRAVGLAGLALGAIVAPAHSAEDIIVSYGALERTIAIADLEAFANGQALSSQLSAYADYANLTESDLLTLRQLLTQPATISQVDVAQFLYTSQGTTLLELLGEVIQTPSRQSGFSAIRGGLILAAADEANGLTLLNFLKKYPTPAIRIDLSNGLQIAAAVTETLDDAERAFALVHALAAESARDPDPQTLAATRQLIFDLPQFEVSQELLKLPERGVEATLFLPQPRLANQSLPDEMPLVVISHGLGDERKSYDYLAQFLAERGFAVASLDHPGSNSDQIAQLLAGFTPQLIDDREFINRPADISALLDEIQRITAWRPALRDRLNTDNVGVIGQSFGGYTALALAGATYDPDTLTAACQPQPNYLNPSLLLQCQATQVATQSSQLRDERVQAIMAINPVGSSIFGPVGFSSIETPTMILAATADTVAPALPEQIKPFTWLQTPDRYLVLASDTTHFSVIDWDSNSEPLIPVPVALLGDSPELAQSYLQVLGLAFMQRHLRQDARYDAALTAQFVQDSVAKSPLEPLSLIDNLRAEALQQAINGDEIIGDRRSQRTTQRL